MNMHVSRHIVAGSTSPRAFTAGVAALFVASAVTSAAWCVSMADEGGMPMDGGWTMSMAWMPMEGQGWVSATTSFAGMWSLMMIAMMLPALAPVLWRCRETAAHAGSRYPSWLAVAFGTGYFVVWAALGWLVFPLGAMLASVVMRDDAMSRAMPAAVGAVMLLAGALQFTAWKRRALACCGEAPVQSFSERMSGRLFWRAGVRHGLHCCQCCAGLTATLLAAGVMDLRLMVLVTLAISAERLARQALPMVRIIGALLICLGLLVVALAAIQA